MPIHRELDNVVGVNVTTISRAYQEAEKRGLVTATVGRGTFITSDLGHNSSLINTDTGERKTIGMGLVLPLYSVEPDIQTVLSTLDCRESLREFMKYTPPQGLRRHRYIAAEWMKRFGSRPAFHMKNGLLTADRFRNFLIRYIKIFINNLDDLRLQLVLGNGDAGLINHFDTLLAGFQHQAHVNDVDDNQLDNPRGH